MSFFGIEEGPICDVLVSQGQSMADAIRQIGLSKATFYRWRQELAGLKNERAKRGSKISSLKTVGCAGQCLI